VGDRREWPVVAGERADRNHGGGVPVGGPAGFDDDDVGIDDTDLHTAAKCGADRVGGQAAVGEQNLDQGTGAGLITEAVSGRCPVVLVVDTEHPRRSRSRQGGGPGQRAGLDPQHLQVVVQHQRLGPFGDQPGMGGDDAGTLEDVDRVGAEADLDTAADEPGPGPSRSIGGHTPATWRRPVV